MRIIQRCLWASLLLVGAGLTAQCASAQSAFKQATPAAASGKITPFQNNDGHLPPKGEYSGPLFQLNHAWPDKPLPALKHAPWQEAIHNGPITVANAAAYAAALKKAVAANARMLIGHYDHWNAARAGWYNEPWLGGEREAIRGTYLGGQFDPSYFPHTGLRASFTTHVLTYYDQRAAYTLRHFWGASAMNPMLKTQNAQFEQGAIIVKAAVFSSIDTKLKLNWWDAMKGAQQWTMFIPAGKCATSDCRHLTRKVWPGYVAQFDIIVKDSQSAPKTGWVFMTLVYDRNAPGKTVWDKMVPLGVQWGNDPQATRAGMTLKENWINPNAPKYSKQTLGWGGRLSGPNDGGRNDVYINGKLVRHAPDSGCMSCHSSSEWNAAQGRMDAFLLPSYPAPGSPNFKTCGPNHGYICSPPPGSAQWMKWFQDRPGDVAMDAGSFATDYDEVFSFKSLGEWCLATQPQCRNKKLMLFNPAHGPRYNQYTGAPLPPRDQR